MEADTTNTGAYLTGGFVGVATDTLTLSYCNMTASLYGSQVGGFVFAVDSHQTLTISYCNSSGVIHATNEAGLITMVNYDATVTL